ncbi:30S ribosomal protein S8 [Candidatus Falkowbacteria bacterium CG10_big_fil_rev_8_21_14_0_10_39_11]|uniref:Small ribosomal subunit protein uS8 n=1 Tax=Candidatus Falkowbacteria bacterium CG10_big_fil_rev_8_21_14_0_10_39_11 TaxID=1974565 RepID=A0A2H0V5T8_9BACT|nr:MAG: 30S ribosomal protein S8 [Candidatus Falkowbacteria bacterium CG10_big_fil_rev_8_21_14_0_10_39_11]
MTDPIADMLTRIRNAHMARKFEVSMPFSKMKMAIAQVLVKEGYVSKAEKVENNFSDLVITLKYPEVNKPAIKVLKRISKGGQRIYAGKNEVPRVLNGYGIAIISTSKGIMTNAEAKKLGVGGEILCEIY